MIDEVLQRLGRTGLCAGRQYEMRQCVGTDLIMRVADFSPSESAVAVAIQSDCIVKVTQGNVPLPLDLIMRNGQREITVARLMGKSWKAVQKPGDDEQRMD